MSAPPTGVLFYDGRAKPLSVVGAIQPGAYYQFYLTQTLTLTNVYADGSLVTPLSQVPGSGGTTAASDGRLVAIYLDPAITYRYQLYSSTNVLLEDIDPYIPVSSPSQTQIGQTLYPRTPAEIAAGVTPVNFAYPPDPRSDVRRYGFSTSNTAAQNTTALNTAILVVTALGGEVLLPAGTFAVTDSIIIPQNVTVSGVGRALGTTLTSNSTGSPLFLLGGTISGVFKYGCGITDLQIVLTTNSGKGIQLMETVGAIARNLYIQGPIAAIRSTKGIVIDGGNVGSFFNLIENVECSHIHIGFDQLTSGTTQTTQQTFIDISASGDVGTDLTSVGFRVQGTVAGMGQATNVYGSDMEACQYGYYLTASCGPVTFYSPRAEGNTDDIYIETNAGLSQWFGGVLDINGGHVLLNNGNNLAASNNSSGHSFIATINGNGMPNVQYVAGNTYFNGFASGDIPLTGVARPTAGASEPTLSLQNTTGTHVFDIGATGKFLRIASGNPVTVTGSKGGNVALAVLVTTLANYGLIVDGTT